MQLVSRHVISKRRIFECYIYFTYIEEWLVLFQGYLRRYIVLETNVCMRKRKVWYKLV